jgi:hypothetical protein
LAERSVICAECGKDMPEGFHVCPECGARRAKTRRSRSAAPEPPGSQVTAVTDAVRTVPRPPAKRKTGFHATRRKNKHHHHHSSQPPSKLAQVLRERDTDAPTTGRDDEEVEEQVLIGPDGEPMGTRRLARRKIYSYGRTRRKGFAYGKELRAILIVLAIGIVLLLMCRLEQGNLPAPQAPDAMLPTSPTYMIALSTAPEEAGPHDQKHQLLVVSRGDADSRHPQDCQDAGLRCG